METFNVVSAGAAQAVVVRLLQNLQLENAGLSVNTRYGAVQAMKACVVDGQAADVVVLTDSLIDELIEKNFILAGSRRDLGAVGTGIAVRAGLPLPDVGSAQALRAALLACSRVVCPDPATATAGKVLLQVLDQLGISAHMLPRLHCCSSGYEAMAQLACGTGPHEIGVMQMTEIIASPDVWLAGPLPGGLQATTVYSAAVAAQSASPERASQFIQRLTAQKDVLRAAGFGDCPVPAETLVLQSIQ
ncbi:MAG: substrate-binding domain-containing protein [Pseudomonadota bacterium]